MGSDPRSDEWRHPEGNEDAPPLPAMPASVRELVDGIDLMISTFRHRDLMPPNMERDMRVRIAAVEAHYAGGA